VTPQPAAAPIATPAREVNLSNDTIPNKACIVGGDNFSNKFVTWRTCESVIAAKEFEVRIADASTQKTNHRVAFGPAGLCRFSDCCAPSLKVNRNHSG
jgi:hypothetical protein